MLAFPVAFLYSGTAVTSFLIVGFAVFSVLACLLLAHCVNAYRRLVRAACSRRRQRAPWVATTLANC